MLHLLEGITVILILLCTPIFLIIIFMGISAIIVAFKTITTTSPKNNPHIHTKKKHSRKNNTAPNYKIKYTYINKNNF